MLIVFLASAALTGCEKKEVEPKDTTTVSDDQEAIKLQKIKRFITIAFKVSESEIVFNQKEEVVLIKGFKLAKKEIEHLYDTANEYKLIYEN